MQSRSSDLNMGLPTVVVLCRLVTIILAGTLTHSDLSICNMYMYNGTHILESVSILIRSPDILKCSNLIGVCSDNSEKAKKSSRSSFVRV